MLFKRVNEKILKFVKVLQGYADRFWYAPLVGLLAALDNLVLVIPNDGILISSSMLRPRRWFALALFTAVGSTLGALILAALVEFHGLPWIMEFYPGLLDTKAWSLSMKFFDQYGLLLVFFVAATPLMQQPAVVLASLAKTPLMELALIIFLGRFIKFLIMAYLGSHAPNLLKRLWGLKGELKNVGIKLK